MSKNTDHLKLMHKHLWAQHRGTETILYYPAAAVVITAIWAYSMARRFCHEWFGWPL